VSPRTVRTPRSKPNRQPGWARTPCNPARKDAWQSALAATGPCHRASVCVPRASTRYHIRAEFGRRDSGHAARSQAGLPPCEPPTHVAFPRTIYCGRVWGPWFCIIFCSREQAKLWSCAAACCDLPLSCALPREFQLACAVGLAESSPGWLAWL
jgi:hypothetical protein